LWPGGSEDQRDKRRGENKKCKQSACVFHGM